MGSPRRYHPILVSLHWLVAGLVFAELFMGLVVFARGVPGVEHPPGLVALHMALGIAVLALVVVRFFVRIVSARPPEALTGSPLLNAAARLVHYGLSITLVAITVVGIIFSVQNHQLQGALFGAQPEEHGAGHNEALALFEAVHPHEAGSPLAALHDWLAWGLLGLVAVHVAAGLYHELVLRDELLGRMWYGPR